MPKLPTELGEFIIPFGNRPGLAIYSGLWDPESLTPHRPHAGGGPRACSQLEALAGRYWLELELGLRRLQATSGLSGAVASGRKSRF